MTTPGFSAPPGATGETEAQLLAQLKGLHLPDPVPFWPPAPGWWMLAGALALLAAAGVVLEWRRRQTLAYGATRELKAIAEDRAHHPDSRAVAAAGALLVRRVLVSRGALRDVALTGAAWRVVLENGKAGLSPEVARFVADAPYLPPSAPGGDAVPRELLVAALARWIKANA